MRILSSLPQRDGCRDSLQGGPKLPRNRLPHSPSSFVPQSRDYGGQVLDTRCSRERQHGSVAESAHSEAGR